MGYVWKGFTATVFVVLTTICLVLVGSHNSLGSTTTGAVWDWGDDEDEELGLGTTAGGSATPVLASGVLTNVIAVAGGEYHSLAVQSGGTVWGWGYNAVGQLGDGTTDTGSTPVQVSGLSGAVAVACGGLHSLALQSGGAVWAWGDNDYGTLGNGTTNNSPTPVQVTGLSGISAVAAGFSHSLAVKSDGTVWAWGNNTEGQLGNGTTNNYSSTPIQVSDLSGVIAVAGGDHHSLALKYDGTVWAWGENLLGELGNGSTNSSSTPVQVSGLSGVIAIASGYLHSLALKHDGTVWAWGDNNYGELGNGSTNTSSTPVQVSSLSGVVSVAGGSADSLALKSDGTVWAWGYDADGELGDGSATDNPTSTPVQVSGLGTVITVAAGGYHSLAVKSPNVFGDISASNYYEQYIDAIYNDKITTGCQNGTIYLDCAPDGSDNVWRDQMAAFIIRALYGDNFTCTGLGVGVAGAAVPCASTTPYFSDVLLTDPNEAAFFPYIQKLYELGITIGCNNGQSPLLYCPSDDVTRDDMAAYIVRASQIRSGQIPGIFTCDGGVSCATETPYFSDATTATEGSLFPYIQKLKELGITTGCSATDYCPSQDVTRDEMAAFIARAFLWMH